MNDDLRAEIQRQIRPLRIYAILMTAVAGMFSLAAFQGQPSRTAFKEIDVERINIVEPDGKLRMVLSNRPRSIGPIYKGKPFGYAGGGRPGIIFFNDEGTENGGLTITGRRDSLRRYQASSSWSFDQFDQDQILTLQYADNNGRRRTGLTVADRDDRNIYDLVMQRDSILAMPDTAARRVAIATDGPRERSSPRGDASVRRARYREKRGREPLRSTRQDPGAPARRFRGSRKPGFSR
ncbi:MAG TPA: hypothetical protein VF128_12345 [Gemmatimonadaceae bacterium]